VSFFLAQLPLTIYFQAFPGVTLFGSMRYHSMHQKSNYPLLMKCRIDRGAYSFAAKEDTRSSPGFRIVWRIPVAGQFALEMVWQNAHDINRCEHGRNVGSVGRGGN
jgi:hypothetical protein